MTVIAYKGGVLAADKRMTQAGAIGTTTKVFRTDDGEYIVGVSGGADTIQQARAWFNAGRDAKTWNGSQEDGCFALAIHRSGRVERYETAGFPIIVEDPFAAAGTGRPYALTAMHLGHSAAEAVAIASALDNGCGNGIDILTFDDP